MRRRLTVDDLLETADGDPACEVRPHDALPEQAFYMAVGTIEEALEKAEQLRKSAA